MLSNLHFEKAISYVLLLFFSLICLFMGKKFFLGSKKAQNLLIVLILADVIFLLLNAFGKGNFHIEQDRSYPEMYGYTEELISSGFLFWLALNSKSRLLFTFCLFFFFLFLDDLLMLHEQAGFNLSKFLDLSPLSNFLAIRERDVGEVFYFLLAGFVFLGVGDYHYVHEQNPWNRRTARKITAAVGTFGFFSLGLDALDHVQNLNHFRHFFGLADDFGEMILLSLLSALCVDLFINFEIPPLARNLHPSPEMSPNHG